MVNGPLFACGSCVSTDDSLSQKWTCCSHRLGDAVCVNRVTYLFRVHHLAYFLMSRMCVCCAIYRTDISVLEVPTTDWKSCPYLV